MVLRRDLEDATIRGRDAQAFLEIPQVKQAFAAVEEKLRKQFFRTPPDQVATLQGIRYTQHALDLLKKELTAPVREGTLASTRLRSMDYQREMENS